MNKGTSLAASAMATLLAASATAQGTVSPSVQQQAVTAGQQAPGAVPPATVEDSASNAATSANVSARAGGGDQAATQDIIVTAQFRAQRLQDTPIAITAVNSAMLEARGQTDIAQVAAQAPNVTLKPQPQGGGSGLIAFIRGVGQIDFNYALDPGVGIYIDDVYIPTLSSSLLDLMDLDRVEILRGPQGTLAGKNSIGGAIKLFSAKPKGTNSGSLRAAYGSYNRVDVRGIADLKITDTLFARVSGVAKSYDGYVDLINYGLTHPNSNVPSNNASGANKKFGTLGGVSYVAGRLALRWVPTDRVEINISGDYTRDHSEANPSVLIAAGAVSTTPNVFNPSSSNPATDPNGNPWLPGKNGVAVPVNCAFVPAGRYSCDTLSGYGDHRFINYANFLDSKVPTSQLPYKPYAARPNREFNGWGVSGNISWDLTDEMQVVSITSYRQYVSKWGEDQDETPVPISQLDNKLDHHAVSEELRLNGKLGHGLLEYTIGGFYFDQDGKYTARVDLNYAGIDFVHGPDTTPSTSKALFANTTFHPTSAWSITGGIRYTKDKKVYTYFRSNPDGTVPFVNTRPSAQYPIPICEFFQGKPTAGPTGIGNTPNCLLTGLYGISDGFKGHRWDWRVVTDYRFSPELLAYASVATGYKGGGVNPRPFFGPSAGDCNAAGYVAPAPCNQLKAFDPETITTFEGGFKSDLFDRRLRLNGAVFYNKYKDIILSLSACPSIPCLQPNNVGKADVKGAELEATIFPVEGLELDGGLSYIDFKYKSAAALNPLLGYVALVGTNVPKSGVTPYTPKWNYSVGVQYDYKLSSKGTIGVRFDGNYQSKIYSESSNSTWSKINGYFLGNARLSYTTPDDGWIVALEVQNLFDKYYFLTTSDITTSLGLVTGQPGMPRTWSISIKKNFR